jgi:hypothetical protein
VTIEEIIAALHGIFEVTGTMVSFHDICIHKNWDAGIVQVSEWVVVWDGGITLDEHPELKIRLSHGRRLFSFEVGGTGGCFLFEYYIDGKLVRSGLPGFFRRE